MITYMSLTSHMMFFFLILVNFIWLKDLYHNSNERLIGDFREISRELTSRDTYPNLLVEVALGIIQRLLELCFDFAELAAGAVQFLNLVL